MVGTRKVGSTVATQGASSAGRRHGSSRYIGKTGQTFTSQKGKEQFGGVKRRK